MGELAYNANRNVNKQTCSCIISKEHLDDMLWLLGALSCGGDQAVVITIV